MRAERTKRGLSPEQVREMLAARGYRVGSSSYAEWESGYKKPSRDARGHLTALWGSEPAAPVPEDDLAAAIREQTAAMQLIAVEMRETRVAEQAQAEALATILGLIVRRLGEPELERVGTSQRNDR